MFYIKSQGCFFKCQEKSFANTASLNSKLRRIIQLKKARLTQAYSTLLFFPDNISPAKKTESQEICEEPNKNYKNMKDKSEMSQSKSRLFQMSLLLLVLPSCHALSENIVCGGEIQTYVCLPKNYSR